MALSLVLLAALLATSTAVVLKPANAPRGWNSWDAFGFSNETTTLAIASSLAAKLTPGDYKYVTVDEGWFGPQNLSLNIDSFGRPIPDPVSFPSSAGTGSFQPLAERLGKLNVTLGLWYMAGLPQKTVAANTPIKGTNYTSQDLFINSSYCHWWDNSWGYEVNHTHPAAQAWYDSLAELWEEWGVGYVKVDCINAYNELDSHRRDIIRLHDAFEKTSHEFVFSLSPGSNSNISQTLGVKPYVTMARSTGDFWDTWDDHMPEHWDAARDLAASIGGGFHIDLDMLPFGRIGHPGSPCTPSGPGCPRHTRYTTTEQASIMTLWCFVKSPLIAGADLTVVDADTVALLSNKTLLGLTEDVDAPMEATRLQLPEGMVVVWQGGSVSQPSVRYVALFNDVNSTVTADFAWIDVGIADGPCSHTNMFSRVSAPCGFPSEAMTLEPHGVRLLSVTTA